MKTTTKKHSLKQLVLLSVSVLILTLLATGTIINFVISKSYVEEQLARYSQDAATYLGLALSTHTQGDVLVVHGRMIDSIFDSGDYTSIDLVDANGGRLFSRAMDVPPSGVPVWFVDIMNVGGFAGRANVMSGWSKSGEVVVVASHNLAANKLWSMFKLHFSLFASVFVAGLMLLYVVLKHLLSPLSDMEAHANELGDRAFDKRVALPNTRELDVVAQAMNQMASRLGEIFRGQLHDIERLRDLARKDSLTGLMSREGFDARLKADLAEHSSPNEGVLVLLAINGFGEININRGRSEADRLLQSVGQVLQKSLSDYGAAYAARRSGAQFSMFLPHLSGDEGERFVNQLLSPVLALPLLGEEERGGGLNMGMAEVESGDSVSNLLSKADLALRQSQQKGTSGWKRFATQEQKNASGVVRQAGEWQQILRSVLEDKKVVLCEQSVFRLSDQVVVHRQVLSRIELDGQLIPASTFLPMAQRFGMMSAFDELVVSLVFSAMSKADQNTHYHLTLSEMSIADDLFIQHLVEQFQENNALLSRLTLEVPEYCLSHGEAALAKLYEAGAEWGLQVCIDRFGVSSVPFTYLQRINVSSIKVDASFVRDVHLNQDNQFFLRGVVQIAHSQNIQVIAVGVESEFELEALREVGVDAAMGYIFEKPTRINI